jgi:WD repeat-containing protein 92
MWPLMLMLMLLTMIMCAWLQARGYGAPELVTCGRDGCVRVWDVRQQDAPVAAFEPADASNIRDCW